jgi:hypothetical protein
MVRVNGKAFRLLLPASADVFIRGESLERFEARGAMIGHQEGLQMRFQVVMSLVVILVHGGVFARAVHAFHWAIRPGMVGCGEPMVDGIRMTDASKNMLKGLDITFAIGELDAVISQHRMTLIGHGGHQVPEALSRDHFVGFLMQLGIGQCAGSVDGDKEGELAFFRAPLRDVEMEVTHRR